MLKKKKFDLEKLKKEFHKINYQKLILSNKALLLKMQQSNEADVLEREVLKISKKWKMVFDVKIRSTTVKMEGLVDVSNSIYNPVFQNLKITVSTVKGFLRKTKEKIEFTVNGSIDNLTFEPKNIDIRYKKLVALFLIPAYIRSVLHPIGMKTFNRIHGSGAHGNG